MVAAEIFLNYRKIIPDLAATFCRFEADYNYKASGWSHVVTNGLFIQFSTSLIFYSATKSGVFFSLLSGNSPVVNWITNLINPSLVLHLSTSHLIWQIRGQSFSRDQNPVATPWQTGVLTRTDYQTETSAHLQDMFNKLAGLFSFLYNLIKQTWK